MYTHIHDMCVITTWSRYYEILTRVYYRTSNDVALFERSNSNEMWFILTRTMYKKPREDRGIAQKIEARKAKIKKSIKYKVFNSTWKYAMVPKWQILKYYTRLNIIKMLTDSHWRRRDDSDVVCIKPSVVRFESKDSGPSVVSGVRRRPRGPHKRCANRESPR